MTELTDKIRSRGYWDAAILPLPYREDRFQYATLDGALARATVRLRGWPVPYIDHGAEIQRGQDWIGQEIDGDVTSHFEAWRFFMSGQFNQLRAVSADWRTGDQATPVPQGFDGDSVVEVWEILYYVTELFELAARFAMTGPPFERVKLLVHLYGLENRGLVVGQQNRAPFVTPYKATMSDYSRETILTSDALLGGASDAAIDMALEFFLRFGWQPPSDQLLEMQRELTQPGR